MSKSSGCRPAHGSHEDQQCHYHSLDVRSTEDSSKFINNLSLGEIVSVGEVLGPQVIKILMLPIHQPLQMECQKFLEVSGEMLAE
jgi:hypothetical protein